MAASDHLQPDQFHIKPGKVYYGAQGNSGRRAYAIDSVVGPVKRSRQVLREGQYEEVHDDRVEVVARRHYPSTGKTSPKSQHYYLPPDAEEITR